MGCVNSNSNMRIKKTIQKQPHSKKYGIQALTNQPNIQNDDEIEKYQAKATIFKKTSIKETSSSEKDLSNDEQELNIRKTQTKKEPSKKCTEQNKKTFGFATKTKQNIYTINSNCMPEKEQKNPYAPSKLQMYQKQISLPVVMELSQEYIESRVMKKSNIRNQEFSIRA